MEYLEIKKSSKSYLSEEEDAVNGDFRVILERASMGVFENSQTHHSLMKKHNKNTETDQIQQNPVTQIGISRKSVQQNYKHKTELKHWEEKQNMEFLETKKRTSKRATFSEAADVPYT